MSDGDKIRLQFRLDVDAYGKQLEQLGLVVSSCADFQQLEEELQSDKAAAAAN